LKLKQFFVIIFELFIILKLYEWWDNNTNLSLGAYLLVIFILFWILNYLLGKLTLTRPIQSTMMFKIVPRASFTKEWFGIIVLAVVCAGFFLSRALVGSKFLTYLLVLIGALAAYKVYVSKNIPIHHDITLWIVGFIFGIAIGSRFTSGWFIITIFVLGHIFLYFLSEPGEREKHLK